MTATPQAGPALDDVDDMLFVDQSDAAWAVRRAVDKLNRALEDRWQAGYEAGLLDGRRLRLSNRLIQRLRNLFTRR